MLGLPERPVRRAISNDLFGDLRTDVWNFFKLSGRCGVDVYRIFSRCFFRGANRAAFDRRQLTGHKAARRDHHHNTQTIAVIRVADVHPIRAKCMCKMLELSMLQRFEQINIVKISRFSTANVEIVKNYLSIFQELQLTKIDDNFAPFGVRNSDGVP